MKFFFLCFFVLIFLSAISAIHMRKSHKHHKLLHLSDSNRIISKKQSTNDTNDTSVLNITENNTNLLGDIVFCNGSNESAIAEILIFPIETNESNETHSDNISGVLNNSSNNSSESNESLNSNASNSNDSSASAMNVSFKQENNSNTSVDNASVKNSNESNNHVVEGIEETAATTSNETGQNNGSSAENSLVNENQSNSIISNSASSEENTNNNTAVTLNENTSENNMSSSINDGQALAIDNLSSNNQENFTNSVDIAISDNNTNNVAAENTIATPQEETNNNNSIFSENNNSTQSDKVHENSSRNESISANKLNKIPVKGPNGETLETVEIVQKLSPYAQVEFHERNKPEFKNNFLVGRPIYVENNITYDETPNIFDKVVTESLTGVVTPVISEPKLWKNFRNKMFHPVPYNEKTGPLEITESPVMQSKPVKVKVEVHSVTVNPKKPKSIDLEEIPNPIKKQVYGNQYDTVINLDGLPGGISEDNQKDTVVSHTVIKNLKKIDNEE